MLSDVKQAACKSLLLTQPVESPEEDFVQIRQGPEATRCIWRQLTILPPQEHTTQCKDRLCCCHLQVSQAQRLEVMYHTNLGVPKTSLLFGRCSMSPNPTVLGVNRSTKQSPQTDQPERDLTALTSFAAAPAVKLTPNF